MKIKKNMSSPDIRLVINEISESVTNYTIDNIYELNDIFVFRLKGFKPGSKRQISLLIEIGKRIHISNFKREFPERPSPKCLTFRKFLKNGKINQISQLGFDRIVTMDVENFENSKIYSVIFEIFGKGNIILIENLPDSNLNANTPSNKVIFALWYRVMRDRALLAGKEFIFPPVRGMSLLDATLEDINKLVEFKSDQIVKVLVKNFGISGEVVEEILSLCNIDKKRKLETVIPEESEKILDGIEKFKKYVEIGPPIIYGDESKKPVTVLPYQFKSIDGLVIAEYKNFNEACDQFFSVNELEQESREEITVINKINQYNKILEKQLSHIESLQQTVTEKRKLGSLLTNQGYFVEELFSTILNANKKGIPWNEISERIELGKEKDIASAKLFQSLNPKNKEITLKIEDEVFSVDFTKNPYEIADKFFEQAKKAESKIKPAQEMIEKINLDIKELNSQKEQVIAIKKAKAVKKRDKKWFEQYHWTLTKTGKLIIAGRNARMNEQLVRKRMEKDNIFLHADVQGAPYTLLKSEIVSLKNSIVETPGTTTNLNVFSEEEMEEAAFIAGCYSKAWKSGLGLTEVYAVNPDQISFTAPSGEYLPKGGIIVSGKRNYFKIPMKLFIGVYFDDIYAYLFVSGSEETITKHCASYSVLTNSDTSKKKSDIAKKLQSYFERKITNPEDQNKLKLLTINDYVMKIP